MVRREGKENESGCATVHRLRHDIYTAHRKRWDYISYKVWWVLTTMNILYIKKNVKILILKKNVKIEKKSNLCRKHYKIFLLILKTFSTWVIFYKIIFEFVIFIRCVGKNSICLFRLFQANEFPSSFESIVRKILRLLYHVVAHIYHCHFREVALLGLHAHLNCVFAHLTLLNQRFNLIDPKETEILGDLEAALLGMSPNLHLVWNLIRSRPVSFWRPSRTEQLNGTESEPTNIVYLLIAPHFYSFITYWVYKKRKYCNRKIEKKKHSPFDECPWFVYFRT